MNFRLNSQIAIAAAFVSTLLLASAPAHAQESAALLGLINAYRAAPGACDGRQATPAAALVAHPVLANLRIATGQFLDLALGRAGYPVAQAEVIQVLGAADAPAAMLAIERRYCRTLLNKQFAAAGIQRSGDSWVILLAQPAPPSPADTLPGARAAGLQLLEGVNSARAMGRQCGERYYGPAPALLWNEALGNAALRHSTDMAKLRFFKHQGKDGKMVADRALDAGYRWRSIAENIAVGQETPEDALAGWLTSPGHCSNIMNQQLTEMGAAYAVYSDPPLTRVYWTQVFGTPR